MVSEPNANIGVSASEDLPPSIAYDKASDAERRAEMYVHRLHDTRVEYIKLTPLWRARLNDTATITAQLIVPIGFATWWVVLPSVNIAGLNIISPAYAQGGSAIPFDPKPIIYLAIVGALFITFILSVWVNYFGKSEKAADHASTVAKTLLGFFIGAATNYLGVVGTP